MNTRMTDVHHPLAAAGPSETWYLRHGQRALGTRASDTRERSQERLLLLTVALIPLAVGWVVWSSPGGATDFNRRVTLAPFDLALGGLLVLWAWARLRAGLARPAATAGVCLAAAFTVAFAIAFAANPSWRGVEYGVRLLAGVAVVDVVRGMSAAAVRRVCVVLVGAGVVESVLAIAQSRHGRGFALYPLDHDGPLFAFGDTHAARGGLSHPYHLTVFLLLAVFAALIGGRASSGRELRLWLGATALLGAGLAVTFSRAMLLGLVPAAALWCIARRDRIGLACTTIVFASGWTTRAQQTTASGADRGRVALAEHGLGIAADHPVTGIGPARYVIALAEDPATDVELLPPHNIVVQAAAELGIAGGVIVALTGLWFARRLLHRSALIIGGAGLLVPFLLLDAYPYVFPTGLAISAIWIGLLENPTLRVRAS
jgi:hypothetical protein